MIDLDTVVDALYKIHVIHSETHNGKIYRIQYGWSTDLEVLSMTENFTSYQCHYLGSDAEKATRIFNALVSDSPLCD